MRPSIRLWIFTLLASAMLGGAPAFADAPVAPAPKASAPEVLAARAAIVALRDNASAGIITEAQASAGVARYVTQARKATGNAKLAEKDILAAKGQTVVIQELSVGQKIVGFMDFINILKVLGVLAFIAGVGFLLRQFFGALLEMFASIPRGFYELLFYAASVGTIWYGAGMSAAAGPYVGLAGCLLFSAAMGFSAKERPWAKKPAPHFATLTAVWGTAALVYGSSLLGFISVIALMGALGFSVLVYPLCYCIGFDDEKSAARATSAAFYILTVAVLLRVMNVHNLFIDVFGYGMIWIGSFVGYCGLLILSFDRYTGKKFGYWGMQAVTMAAGVAALFVGSVFGISELQKIGGTFFILYLVTKMADIPVASKTGYAVVGVIGGGAVWGVGAWMTANIEAMRPYLVGF